MGKPGFLKRFWCVFYNGSHHKVKLDEVTADHIIEKCGCSQETLAAALKNVTGSWALLIRLRKNRNSFNPLKGGMVWDWACLHCKHHEDVITKVIEECTRIQKQKDNIAEAEREIVRRFKNGEIK